MNENITDLLDAVKEEGTTTALESQSFQVLITEVAGRILSGPAANIAGEIIGAAAPRINGIILTYKQNRFERNMIRLMKELTARIDSLESNYINLNEEMQEQYRSLFVEMLLDSVVAERQEEKVKWSANGFVDLMTNDSNENIMQIFFDTLTELTVLDIDTLKMHSINSDINWNDIERDYRIDYDRLKLVNEKLVRLGLLYRENDQMRDDNLDEIVEYLKKCEAESKKVKPRSVKLPNKIKKVRSHVAYKVSRLGYEFLESIGEISRKD